MLIGIFSFVIIVSFAYVFSSETQWHEDRILCVSLDEAYVKTKEVEQFIKERKKVLYQYLGISLLCCVVYPWIGGFALLYALVHMAVTLTAYRKWGRDSQRLLKELKEKQHWQNISAKQIRIDTDLSKKKRNAPKGLLSVPILGMVILLFLLQDMISRGIGVVILLIQCCFLYLFLKTRPYAYCDVSKINEQICVLHHRVMFQSYLITGILLCIDQGLLIWKIKQESTSLGFLFLFSLINVCACAIIMGLIRKYRKEKKKCLSFQKQEVVDEDAFWSFGFFGPMYHNPYDPRWFRSISRSGQYCINGAKPLVHIASVLCVFGGVGLLTWYDVLPTLYHSQHALVDIRLENNQVIVDSPFYQHAFPIADIEKVEYRESIGKGRRTNGFDNTIYATGKFTFDDYGKAKVYMIDDTNAYILLYTKDGLYVINEDTDAETKAAYEEIIEGLGE